MVETVFRIKVFVAKQRDYQDTHREIAPLKMARDSVKLDTSELDIDGVIAAMKEIIARKVTL